MGGRSMVVVRERWRSGMSCGGRGKNTIKNAYFCPLAAVVRHYNLTHIRHSLSRYAGRRVQSIAARAEREGLVLRHGDGVFTP